jgi:protein-S-isoprenylcysteine O-methyltransferase Ste14
MWLGRLCCMMSAWPSYMSDRRIVASATRLWRILMNIEKRNTKMFNVISIVFLAAILLTVVGGIVLQRMGLPAMVGNVGTGRGHDPIRPESTQTSPTGEMVMVTGIILLTIGFVVTVLILLVRRNWLQRNPS